jgi:hypothetical protein
MVNTTLAIRHQATRHTANNFQFPWLQYTKYTLNNIIILTGEDDYSQDRFLATQAEQRTRARKQNMNNENNLLKASQRHFGFPQFNSCPLHLL